MCVADFDASTPSIARVYDYFLGGRDNFAADRVLAQRLIDIFPPIPVTVRENKQFLERAVTWMAGEGIGQFIDVGCGLPTTPSTHGTARIVNPDARVAYVDRDPVVTDHGRVLVPPGVRYSTGDLAEPEAILASADVAGFLDLSRPVCLILTLVLQALDPGTARAVAGVLVRALAPGSYLIATAAPGSTGRLPDFTWPLPFTPDDLGSFFAGLDLLPPGVHEGPGAPEGRVLCAAGIKPGGARPGERA